MSVTFICINKYVLICFTFLFIFFLASLMHITYIHMGFGGQNDHHRALKCRQSIYFLLIFIISPHHIYQKLFLLFHFDTISSRECLFRLKSPWAQKIFDFYSIPKNHFTVINHHAIPFTHMLRTSVFILLFWLSIDPLECLHALPSHARSNTWTRNVFIALYILIWFMERSHRNIGFHQEKIL